MDSDGGPGLLQGDGSLRLVRFGAWGFSSLARKQGINGATEGAVTGGFCVVKSLCLMELKIREHLHEYSLFCL